LFFKQKAKAGGMIKKWLAWINYALFGIIVLLLLFAFFFWWTSPMDFPLGSGTLRKAIPPKGAFARSPHEYESISPPALSLTFSPLSVQLPDLRKHLIYYGKNGRPDANEEHPVLYLAFTGNKMPFSVSPGERLYVMYDKRQVPPQYTFSPGNTETPLWIEATQGNQQALIRVGMKGDQGQVIREPTAYAEFTLPEKEFIRTGGTPWEIGKWRVDGTLLARQKARWFGIDRFLEKHGGEEFKDLQNKQRIDFGEGTDVHSVFVGQGNCMIWENEEWRTVKPGEASLKYPLMCVKKIDERVMNLELWDVDGKGKMVLNLIKANEAWMPQNLEQNFKFVGARTRSQFVFEVNHERMLLSPHDWLLLTESGWKKLATPKEIDDYVERKTIGPLFVFDKIERKDDRQVILGTLFNAARTEMVSIELPLQQGVQPQTRPIDEKKQKVKETNVTSMVKTGDKLMVSIPATPNDDDDDDDDDDEF
jgi:hypothetical protein